MPKLIATKAMTYATRRLRAGDEFEATNQHARILKAIGKASAAKAEPKKPEPVIDVVDVLRRRATEMGIKVDGRWSEARLRSEIEYGLKAKD